MINRAARIGLLTLGVLAAATALGWWQVDGPGAPPDLSDRRPVSLQEMEFSLVDQDGNPVGPETLAGRPSIVFFGFTWCPDVCPTTLADISGWLDELGPDAERLNVVFITVDPERDTVAVMADYVSAFHPRIRGWTGAPDEIAKAAEGFRVRTEKIREEGDAYAMNHTASVFLHGASGEFLGAVDYHEPREYALPKIRRALETIPESQSG